MRERFSRLSAIRARVLVALLLVAVVGSVPFGPQVIQAAGEIVFEQQLSSTTDQSEVPQISTNGTQVGVIWGERIERNLGISSGQVDGALGAATYLDTGTNVQFQWPDIVMDARGTQHIAYAVGNSVFYRNKPSGGDWSAASKIGEDPGVEGFPNPVRLAVAPNNRIWIVWRENNGAYIAFRYSDDGTNWSTGGGNGLVAQEAGNMFSPDIAIGSDNVPHVVWYIRSGSSADRGEIKYADWNGSAFVPARLTNDGATLYDADPVIAIDSSNVQHVAYRKQIGENWQIVYARRAPGGAWTDFTPVGQTAGNAGYSPAIGTDTAGSIFITYTSFVGSSTRNIFLVARPAGEAWQPAQSISGGRWDTRSAVTGANSEALVAYQHEQGTDDGEIIYKRVRFAAPGPSAVPVIESGQPFSNKQSLSVAFGAVSGAPTEVRWRWGAPPTDAASDSNGWQPYTASISVALPSGLTSDCKPLSLFTQTRAGTALEASAKSDTIVYDPTVQASVNAVNPHLTGLPSIYTNGQLQDLQGQGASDGARNYTRDRIVFVGLSGASDCSGVTTMQIGASEPMTVTQNFFQSAMPLPGDLSVGEKSFDIVVTDGAGNRTVFNQKLTYDPLEDGETAAANDGAPVVRGGTVTDSTSANTVLRTLSFSGVDVTDNVYGTGEQLGDTTRFWGVWIANSRTSVSDPNSASLRWVPVRVAAPGGSFNLEWSVFSGLGQGTAANQAGDYFVYVKFLDGAGNASVETISTRVTLEAGYTFPKVNLPMLRR